MEHVRTDCVSRTSSRLKPSWAILSRLICTRTAGFCSPWEVDEPDATNLQDLRSDQVVGIAVDFGQRQGVRGQR